MTKPLAGAAELVAMTGTGFMHGMGVCWGVNLAPRHLSELPVLVAVDIRVRRRRCLQFSGIKTPTAVSSVNAPATCAKKPRLELILLRTESEDTMASSQCGRNDIRCDVRSESLVQRCRTIDMIFAARQLQENCQEMRTHLYTTFLDLTKAFDTGNRNGLWKIMQKFGCPELFTHMVRQLHDGMMARVTDNGTVSKAFAVTNGVKLDCALAPSLFCLMFSAMLTDAYREKRPGIRIAYRMDG
ncbi:unnamed protein product [Schistocephalus solidus]|uniref:Reverse transcriptase domain-containing protein n=1 Tax=Schistocephalus solidus TaxID=70667 RepID=A0A183TEG4_SCHSO|nr:unnamed protein product [Schistocephalus solidus]